MDGVVVTRLDSSDCFFHCAEQQGPFPSPHHHPRRVCVFYILYHHTPNGRRGSMPAGYINTVNVNQELSRRRRGAAAAAGGGSGGDGGLLGRLTQQFGGKG